MQQNWFDVEAIDNQTFVIKEDQHWEQVRSYLLIGSEKAVLIDAGLGVGNLAKVVKSLTDKPVTLLISHVHWDHIGGAGFFPDRRVHQLDEDWLVNGIPVWDSDSVRKDLIEGSTGAFPADYQIADFELFTGSPSELLEDGQVLDLGQRQVQVIHTPGHSPGHLSFFDVTNGYLFVGDILYVDAPVYAFYPSTSPADLVASLEKLTQLKGVKRVFSAHNRYEITEEFAELPKVLAEMKQADVIKHGTGLQEFPPFSFKF